MGISYMVTYLDRLPIELKNYIFNIVYKINYNNVHKKIREIIYTLKDIGVENDMSTRIILSDNKENRIVYVYYKYNERYIRCTNTLICWKPFYNYMNNVKDINDVFEDGVLKSKVSYY